MTAAPPSQSPHGAAAPGHLAPYQRFLDCVHCGLCLSACPTYVELGTEADSPRGRIYLMRALEDGALPLTADVARHLDLCLGCRACETACPSGVHYGELIEGARAVIEAHYRRGFWDRLRRYLITTIFPHPQRLRLLLLPARLLELLGLLSWLRRLSPAIAMLPRLQPWTPLPAVSPASGNESGCVALLEGCVAQVLFAATNRATVRVLNRNGYRVDTPAAQGCCGALYLHAGDRSTALDCARRNIDVFSTDLDAIVTNAAGCGAMLEEYGTLLGDDPAYAERARVFSAKVLDVTELLAARPLTPCGRIDARVTYHDACHLAHGQGVRAAPRALLAQIPGLQVVELPEADVCCGSAGSYNLTEPEMALRLGDRKAANVCATGATVVAACNPGCIMQIDAALRRAGVRAVVQHPIELLDRAYHAAP
jgi:glycolate oxidase iron-sulfur subunit